MSDRKQARELMDAARLRDAAANPGGKPLDRPGIVPRGAAVVERVRSAIEDA